MDLCLSRSGAGVTMVDEGDRRVKSVDQGGTAG